MKKSRLSAHKSGAALVAAVATMAVLGGCTSLPKPPPNWPKPSVSVSGLEITDSRYADKATWREEAANQLEAELTKSGWFRYYQKTNDVDYFIRGTINNLGRNVTIKDNTQWVQMSNTLVEVKTTVQETALKCNVNLRYFEPASGRTLATGQKDYQKISKTSPLADRKERVGQFPLSDAEYQELIRPALHGALSELLSQLKTQSEEAR